MADGMTKDEWATTWDVIIDKNVKMWKMGEESGDFKKAYDVIASYTAFPATVLIPCAGDSPFVAHAHSLGSHVVALEWVPAAVNRMKDNVGVSFSESLESPEFTVYNGTRIQIGQGDLFKTPQALPAIEGTISVLYDKDAFGAIDPSQRGAYLDMVCWALADGAFAWVEVKQKITEKEKGPPFHLDGKDMERLWGSRGFTLVDQRPEWFEFPEVQWTQYGYLFKYSKPQ